MSFYAVLFQIAGLAIAGWIPLIFFPKWRGTRRLAESHFFPIFISVLYAFGVGALLMERGPGFMADFGTDVGVARLLAQEEIAWVAWLHILAFDQVIALWIYRENMQRGYVPLPVQSVLLFVTLMLAPLGYLAFMAIRAGKLGTGAFIGDSGHEVIDGRRAPPAVRDESVPTRSQLAAAYREERTLTTTALAGMALGAVCLVAVFVRGPIVAPEGDLMKPATFNLALGIFILSLIPWLPASGFTEGGRRLWRRWMTAMLIYAFGIETIQQARGIDPRFSQAEPASQIFGLLFFATALVITVLSIGLGARAFEARASGRRGLMVVSARWAAASMLVGFIAGMWLSANQGRFVGAAGNLLPLHAAGFHGVQAVPLVALMLAWSSVATDTARRWVHVAGGAWLATCLAIWWQTGMGRAVTEIAGAGLLAALLLAIWSIAAVRGLIAWKVNPRVTAQIRQPGGG